VHLRLIAVGDRQPDWVDAGFKSYTTRFPPVWKFKLEPIATGQRGKGGGKDSAVAAEGGKILQKLKHGDQLVALDENGRQFSSRELADQLRAWQGDGRDVAFVIGGPDGLSEEFLGRADHVWSLSRLTLPHGLARILFAEQLYRAWSITEGHPYHRD